MHKEITRVTTVGISLVLILLAGAAHSQPYPNPYRTIEGWTNLPDGRTWSAAGDLVVDPDRIHMWAVVRCDATAPDRFGDECVDSDLDSILKFEAAGNMYGGESSPCRLQKYVRARP